MGLFDNRRPTTTSGVRRGTPNWHFDPTTGYTIVDVQETDDGPRPGTALKPIVEEYEGHNNPYRGTEDHGVHPLYNVPPPDDSWEGGMAPVNPDRLDEEPEAVQAVRIVNVGAREIKEWRSFRVYATATPTILVGKFDARESFTLKNLSDTVTVYVGGDMQVSRSQGFPVAPGTEFSVDCDTEVWGISDDGSDVDCAVYVVFAVEVK